MAAIAKSSIEEVIKADLFLTFPINHHQIPTFLTYVHKLQAHGNFIE